MLNPEPTPVAAPPPAPPTQTTPKEDDRLLAACAHLSFFTGLWLIAPLAIYAIKRKQSRFVALYALQAALLQVFFGAVAMIGGVAALVVTAFAMILSRGEAVGVLLSLLPMLIFAFGCLGLLTVHLVAAYHAWQGHTWQVPLAGRLAVAIMGADEGAAKV